MTASNINGPNGDDDTTRAEERPNESSIQSKEDEEASTTINEPSPSFVEPSSPPPTADDENKDPPPDDRTSPQEQTRDNDDEEATNSQPQEETIEVTSPPTTSEAGASATTLNLEPYLKELEKYQLKERLSNRLALLFSTSKLTINDLDNRAIDALKEYGNMDAVIAILDEFENSSLDHVNNKSAYLCGLMKTHRQKEKALKHSKGMSLDSTGSSSRGDGAVGSNANGLPSQSGGQQPGPDEANLKAILERTGYTLDITSGQRKYGGPPPEWEGPTPGPGCEIFVGKIPKEIFEDELIPIFEKVGKIWDLRLMIDPINGYNRGFAFITYCNKEDASSAQSTLDGYEIRKGKALKVNVSVPNLRLFVGNIPKSKSREEILQEFSKLTLGLSDVIVYSSPDDRKKNRGFCFLEYDSHKSASLAKRKLSTGRVKVWGCDILVDWADPQEEPDQETMSKVKVLYVRNLVSDVTEDELRQLFEQYGTVDRVKKIKDYAFVHFGDRDQAITAMNNLNDQEVREVKISVSLAKPPSDRKKKEEMLRNRERRVQLFLQQRAMVMGPPVPPMTLAAAAAAHAAAIAAAGVHPGIPPPIPPHHVTGIPANLTTAQQSSTSGSGGGASGGGGHGRGKGNRGQSAGGQGSSSSGYSSTAVPSGQQVPPYHTHRSVPPYAAGPANTWFPTDWLGYQYPTQPAPPNWPPTSWGYQDPRTAAAIAHQGQPNPAATSYHHQHHPRNFAAGNVAVTGRTNNRGLWTPNGNAQQGQGTLSNGPPTTTGDPSNNSNKSKTWTNRNRNNRGSNNNSDAGGGQGRL